MAQSKSLTPHEISTLWAQNVGLIEIQNCGWHGNWADRVRQIDLRRSFDRLQLPRDVEEPAAAGASSRHEPT